MRLATLALALLLPAAAGAQPLTALTSCCPNTVVSLDPATGETTAIAEIGTASDLFQGLVGSASIDVAGQRAFMVRNGLIVTADLVTGAVTEGPEAFDLVQLAGYDATRDQLLAFASERVDVPGEPTRITNYVVGYRPATQDTVRIARVGAAVIDGGPDDPDDTFGSVSGVAVADGDRLFTIRNDRLVTVELSTGTVTEGDVADGQLLGYDATAGERYRLARETVRDADSVTYTGRIVRETETTRDTLALVTEATVFDDGTVTGDTYLASFGVAVYDAPGDRVVLSRNGEYLTVDLATGALREGAAAAAGVVGGALGAAVVSAQEAPRTAVELSAAPNPARGTVRIALGTDGPAVVDVIDALGRRVARLAEGAVAGPLRWDTSAVPSGVYRVRARTADGVATATVTVAR